ncbi:MAG: histidine phosphatase family protein [Nonlabens sp.]
MKTLTIVRHGKSSWEHQVRDHDRPLNERGINDGHLIGKYLKSAGIQPDRIVTSTAARALQTATIVVEYIDYGLNSLRLDRSLYTFDSREQLKFVKHQDPDCDHLMIFSHNHGLTDLVNYLGSSRFDNVPTTGVVTIEFDCTQWVDINNGNTTFHVFPKDLK